MCEYNFRELNKIDPKEGDDFIEYMLKETEGELSLRYPVVIITCKNRKNSIFKNIDEFKNCKVYVYIYETEKELYDWLDKPFIEKIYVSEEYRTAQKMRVFVQNTMKEPIFHFLDDDLKNFYFYRRGIYVSAIRGLKIAENLIHDEDWGIIGYSLCDTATHFRKQNIRIMHGISYIIINNKLLLDNDIHYDGDIIAEDFEICLDAAKKGIYSYEFMFMRAFPFYKMGRSGSIASSLDKTMIYIFNDYMKFGCYFPIRINKHGMVIGRGSIKDVLVKKKEQIWDRDILEACRERNLKNLYRTLIGKKLCHRRWERDPFPYDLLDNMDFIKHCYIDNKDPLKFK